MFFGRRSGCARESTRPSKRRCNQDQRPLQDSECCFYQNGKCGGREVFLRNEQWRSGPWTAGISDPDGEAVWTCLAGYFRPQAGRTEADPGKEMAEDVSYFRNLNC